jgi:hypothetical protein
MTLEDTGSDSTCEYSIEPIEVILYESGLNEVQFTLTNNWNVAMDNIDLFYDRGDGLGPQCQSLNSLASGAMYTNPLAAACNATTQTAEIQVSISNENIDHSSSIGECGVKGARSCSYVYVIPCSTCVDERRLESTVEDTFAIDSNIYIEEGFMTEEMKAAAEPSDESDDTPYCVHKDDPCKGDEENMVYVCHYSSQAGYQTFCIPEMDSDILRFNENHHCGPCDGWNGAEYTGVVN